MATIGDLASSELARIWFDELSEREREIAWRAACGMSNSRIAVDRGISVKTVEKHLTAAYRKFGVDSRTQLVLAVLRSTQR